MIQLGLKEELNKRQSQSQKKDTSKVNEDLRFNLVNEDLRFDLVVRFEKGKQLVI